MTAATNFQWPTAPIPSKFFAEQGRPEVLKWDVLELAPNSELIIRFKQVLERRQGIWMAAKGGFSSNGNFYEQVNIWADTVPPEVRLTCRAEDGRLQLYNIWDPGSGRRSQMLKTGMIKTAIPGGFRYGCNDTGPDIDFERFVFELIIVAP
jgi:hypothetical protein